MILLDEVFVGVDTANRGQIFALLSALDLDLILTSDHEWCTTRMSGIAIHQIVGGDDDAEPPGYVLNAVGGCFTASIVGPAGAAAWAVATPAVKNQMVKVVASWIIKFTPRW